MAGILDAVLGSVFNVITMGIKKGCPQGFVEYVVPNTEPKILKCKGQPPVGSGLRSDNPDPTNPETEIFVKSRYYAEDMNIASGRNCPAGMFPFDGRCWRACPKYFERQLVDPATLPKQEGGEVPKQPVYRCVAACERDWHPLTWTGLGNRIREQGMANSDTTCYHKLPHITDKQAEDKEFVENQVNVPFNLEVEATPTKAGVPTTLYKGGAIDTGPRIFEQPGIYANRRRTSLGPAVLAQPCTTPNQLTINGRCVKPCAANQTLIGDNCVNTSMKCPVGTTIEDDETRAFCKPIIKDMPMGPSILTIIASLGAISVIGGLGIRALRARRPAE